MNDHAYDTADFSLRNNPTVEAARQKFIELVSAEPWAIEQFDAARIDFQAESLI
ncbi:hypothetical protein [Rhizobium sp. NXC14]|uniref:hypothetical protein n=1 Tax=Rhizobium sp. NXC14 TaxID=1981173 RepID=UPI0018DCCD6A|nr:hypothetical protein [Rhizobium sp. NXC14]